MTDGNREIDSVIGKANDCKALATMIDKKTEQFAAQPYDCGAQSFLEATILNLTEYPFVTLTMDIGDENDRLGGKLLKTARLFNWRVLFLRKGRHWKRSSLGAKGLSKRHVAWRLHQQADAWNGYIHQHLLSSKI